MSENHRLTPSAFHDAEKRLLSVTGIGHSAQFVYDGLGRCVKRTIDGVTTVFTYDNWKPIAEWTGDGTLVAWNLYGAGADEILVRYKQNPECYLHYHLDPMGNVQFLLSDGPEPGLEKYTYDVFGKPRIVGWNGDVRPISNHGNRFLFTGREYLYTFGLYDYRHRIYHPGLGRFIQTDPLGQQIEGTKLSAQQTALYALGGPAPEKFSSSELNLYRYCHNDPVNHSDPTGLETLTRPEIDDQLGDRVVEVSKLAGKHGHSILDAVGTLDPTPTTDLINAGWYAAGGDRSNAAISVVSALPYLGDVAKIGKYGAKAAHWGNPNTLVRHFKDHGADFAAKNASDYAKKASDFLKQSQANKLPTKIGPDGTIRVSDPKTNTFGAYNPDGTTKTFFKPDSSTYFDRQPGLAPK